MEVEEQPVLIDLTLQREEAAAAVVYIDLDAEEQQQPRPEQKVVHVSMREMIGLVSIGAKAYHTMCIKSSVESGTPILFDTIRARDNYRLIFAWYPSKLHEVECIRVLDLLLACLERNLTVHLQPRIIRALIVVLTIRKKEHTFSQIEQDGALVNVMRWFRSVSLGRMVPVLYPGQAWEGEITRFEGKELDIYALPHLISCFRFNNTL